MVEKLQREGLSILRTHILDSFDRLGTSILGQLFDQLLWVEIVAGRIFRLRTILQPVFERFG